MSVFCSEEQMSAQKIVESNYLYKNAPFLQSHANTIIETLDGDLLSACFGGTKEGEPDVCIWLSRKKKDASSWSGPEKMIEGNEGSTCYNPVLFQLPLEKGGDILFFYKIAPAFKYGMSEGYVMRSSDGGYSWSEPVKMEGLVGPCKNQPVLVGDRLISPSSGPHPKGWRCHFEISDDLGYTWRKVEMTAHDPAVHAAQPTLLVHDDGRLQALFRTSDGYIATSWSHDVGETWSREEKIGIRNNNSGIDAVRLRDGRFVLIYNDTGNYAGKRKGPRTPLCLAISTDGLKWDKILTLEDQKGEYSYPTIIQGQDGDLHAVYTYYQRDLAKHVKIRLPDSLNPNIYHPEWIDFNKNGKKDVYEDRDALIEDRIADLKSMMTSEEIKGQIREFQHGTVFPDEITWAPTVHLSAVHEYQRNTIEKTRLGIPAIFRCDALRGVHHKNTTNFPSLLTIGAGWDLDVAAATAGTIAEEARSLGYSCVEYPAVNHIVDPFCIWSRDSYGESATFVEMLSDTAAVAIKRRGLFPLKADHFRPKSKLGIDEVLRIKFEIGLFDNPFIGDHSIADFSVHKKEQLAVARMAASKGLVLLKNTGNILPLRELPKKIAVIGPNSSEVRRFYSESGPIGTRATTVVRMMRRLMPDTEIIHEVGCSIKDPNFPESERQDFPLTDVENQQQADAVRAVESAELAIVVLGGNNDTNNRTTLELSGRQIDLLEAISAVEKPVIVIMLDNRAAVLDDVNKYADAILHAWYPGEETSMAVVQALLGEINPGGKLPVTMPSKSASIPITFPLKGKNDAKHILYPFGYGLSYTTFDVYGFSCVKESDNSLTVCAKVKNSGQMSGEQVVQVYMAAPKSVYRKQLAGFQRVYIEPGEEKCVKIVVPERYIPEGNQVNVMAGTSSEDILFSTIINR